MSTGCMCPKYSNIKIVITSNSVLAVPPPSAGTVNKPEVNSCDNESKLLTGFLLNVALVNQLGFINDSS